MAAKPAIVEGLVKHLVDKEVEPIREKHKTDVEAAKEQQSKAHAQAFRAKHPDITPEIEAKIMEIGKTIFPAEGTDPIAYLDTLYTLATAGNTARATAKVGAERIKAAAAASEPRRGAVPATKAKSVVTEDMTLDQAFDAAWAAAK